MQGLGRGGVCWRGKVTGCAMLLAAFTRLPWSPGTIFPTEEIRINYYKLYVFKKTNVCLLLKSAFTSFIERIYNWTTEMIKYFIISVGGKCA